MRGAHLSICRGKPGRKPVECTHCGGTFMASAARRKRGPLVCAPCARMIFEKLSGYHSRQSAWPQFNTLGAA